MTLCNDARTSSHVSKLLQALLLLVLELRLIAIRFPSSSEPRLSVQIVGADGCFTTTLFGYIFLRLLVAVLMPLCRRDGLSPLVFDILLLALAAAAAIALAANVCIVSECLVDFGGTSRLLLLEGEILERRPSGVDFRTTFDALA